MYPDKLVNLYNPQNQTEKELLDSFVVRNDEFYQIFNDIRYSRTTVADPHLIIQGQRGQGKTTLLLKLYYETKNDDELKWRFVPIIFNEEQYDIYTLFDLWENVAEELEELLDLGGLTDEIGRYTRIYSGNPEVKAFEMLKLIAEKYRRKLILFIDNFGDILTKFNHQDRFRLFEVLMHHPEIRIIGTSTFAPRFEEKEAAIFRGLFNMVTLKGLNRKETVKLFLKLGEHLQPRITPELLEKETPRLEALRKLTSGIPRTIVLLFEVFTSHSKGNSFKDLELILDRVTPLYKHRMDDLPPQQQIIVNVAALNWDAVSLNHIVKKTRLEPETAATQLSILEDNHIVFQVDKQYYQLMDRFFNIWYLMRYGKKQGRMRVQWFVQFLEYWNSPGDLERLAKEHITSLEGARGLYDKHAFYMTEALARTGISTGIQHAMIQATREFLEKKNASLSKELSQSDTEKLQTFVELFEKEDYKGALECLESILSKNDLVYFNIGFLYMDKFQDLENAEKYYTFAAEKGHLTAMYNLALLYENHLKDYRHAEKYYLMASARGHVKATNNLALLYANVFRSFDKAEKYFFVAAREGDVKALFNLGILYENHFEDAVKGEKYYAMAIKKGHRAAIYNMINLYFRNGSHKNGAFNLARKLYDMEKNMRSAHLLCLTALWNDDINMAYKIADVLVQRQDYIEDNKGQAIRLFLFFLARKYYKHALKLFLESPYHLKERFKPIFFAIVLCLKDEYPDEYKKMGAELRETVREIMEKVDEMATKYA